MDGRFRRAVGTRLLHRYTWTWSCIRQIAHKPGPSRPLGEPKTSAAVGVLAKSVAKYVPLTFTSITQVQRLIPDEERKVLDASGGLIAVLQAHPSLFTVRRFGAVDAARRLLSVIPESNETNTPPPPAPSTPAAVEAVVLPQLRSIFPSFLVPVRALWRDGDAAQCAQRQSQILQIIEDSRCRQFLQYVPYPGREGTIEAGYVRLSVCVPTPTGKSEHSPDLQYANFEVEPYEWYRVAALLPSTAPVPITDDLQQRAAEILQPNQHDLMHVLLSGPHLFRVSVEALSSSPSVAFLLHPKFPILAENDTVESIQRELLHLEASRSTSTYKMNFSARRRMLRRKLEFLHAPTPFFNEHVFLQYLVDQLPERTAVTLTSFVANLPQSLVMHFPSSIKRFLQMHPHFFFVFHMDGDGEACVQRADAPRPESRPIESIAVEEVLMAIFVRYPMKRHPHNGICVFQVLASLSPAHVDRLYDITDVEAWLRQCPDKVEILTPFPQQDSHHTKQENSTPMSPEEERPFTVSADKIVSARGRTDFFVRFRYIGEWQEKLLERYSKAHPSQSA